MFIRDIYLLKCTKLELHEIQDRAYISTIRQLYPQASDSAVQISTETNDCIQKVHSHSLSVT